MAGTVPVVAQLTAEQVVQKMEANQVHETSKSTGSMIITNQFGTRTKTFTTIAEGEDKMLLEFTNKTENGQKILRVKDEIYLYYPEEEVILRLQGGALKESIFGSNFSYEDLTGEKGILSSYSATFSTQGTVIIDGIACYHISLSGKKSVSYPYQEIWVEANRFVLKKASYYSLTKVKLKELTVLGVTQLAGKYIPSHFLMIDVNRKDSKTEFKLENMQVNVKLPANQFSLERLSF